MTLFQPKQILCKSLLICTVHLGFVGSSNGANVDKAVVESWVSSNRYFSFLEIEISRNKFLPEGHSEFTKEPTEMVLVEGGLLPHSFYVSYDKSAYGQRIIQGETDSDCWALEIDNSIVLKGSKDAKLGGATTNWVRIATSRQKQHLRDYTQYGFVFVRPDSLQVTGTNFIAVSEVTGSGISGFFASIDESGLPHYFKYDVAGTQDYHVEGEYSELDIKQGRFDCVVAFWEGKDLLKRVRIRTKSGFRQAVGTELKRIFQPSDFIKAKTTLIESNNVKYVLLPSGKMRPESESENKNSSSGKRSGVWTWLILANLIFFGWLLKQVAKAKQKKSNQQQTKLM